MLVLWLLLLIYCSPSSAQNATDGDTQHGPESTIGKTNRIDQKLNDSLTDQPVASNQSDVSTQSTVGSNQSNVLAQTKTSMEQSDLLTNATGTSNQSDVSTQTTSFLDTQTESDQSESREQSGTDASNTPVEVNKEATYTTPADEGEAEGITGRNVSSNEMTEHGSSIVSQNTTIAAVVKSDIPTSTEGHAADRKWMKTFLSIHHFDGWYTYENGKFPFDFVARFVHPTDSRTLVATFYDEDGAILDMNGTSVDGHIVTFTTSKLYSESFRFPAYIVVQLNGSFVDMGDNCIYSGTVTLPLNSSFHQFYMDKGRERSESVDERTSKTAAIIAVVSCISFLFVLGTGSLICWAMRRGYLRKHKSYQLFGESSVAFEADAETVHI